MGSAYDRERVLKHRPNAFLHERLGLPASDDYSRLNEQALSELKSVLSDINNIFTLKGCLVFGEWLSTALSFDASAREKVRSAILRSPPNANGYDVEVSDPARVIAETKCNIPINGGAV